MMPGLAAVSAASCTMLPNLWDMVPAWVRGSLLSNPQGLLDAYSFPSRRTGACYPLSKLSGPAPLQGPRRQNQ